jgi:hypothetical protein
MDAKQYMDEIVDPTISEFAANRASRRHAFLACVVTFHTIDYFMYPEKPGNQRKSFRNESRDFAQVDRVAHAFKHVQSGHDKSHDHTPLQENEVLSRPPARCGKLMAGLSQCGDEIGGVTLLENPDDDLLDVVKNAAEYLRGKIGEAG